MVVWEAGHMVGIGSKGQQKDSAYLLSSSEVVMVGSIKSKEAIS